jgi:lipid-A-disaccharide synthase
MKAGRVGALKDGTLKVFVVAGEESGDQLGSRLMDALIRATGGGIRFSGVGGTRMQALGLSPLFNIQDIAVMGISAVLGRLPTLLRRIRQTVEAVVETAPDVLVIIDSPDFTHRVAKAVRRRLPTTPIVAYVSPTVWAWRPGRARRMADYVDQLLAILPFEPEVHARLGGPPTTYVGHPLTDRPDLLLPATGERAPLDGTRPPILLALPGSRAGEVRRCLPDIAAVIAALDAAGAPRPDVVIPAVPHLEDRILQSTADWPIQPRIARGEAEKFAAFRSAHAAITVSGTVTLELALSGVPMTVIYRRDPLFRAVTEVVRRIPGQVNVNSMVLPNIILGQNLVPEHLDGGIDPGEIAAETAALLRAGPERRTQVAGFRRLWDLMRRPGAAPAADAAAMIVLRAAGR